ncbi:beta-N-acetylhexosaminidase [Leucobacter komagatae]|uniref:Beta-N-acetylhexosaminidase n=1 Tax=Leucobacter komagatae TaxID=55969 RepID=A0A542Y906_9MICO|nr:glycoside hydrolase family 3 N-terminal domain-containing protein [Leucobacter komagatae]TQL44474.1 beta-N-acetylhexosaminidase [Leucobacter komagatae]
MSALERDILATLMPGFVGFEPPAWLSKAFAAGLTSACVYGNNVRDREQLRALGLALRDLAPHALLAIDEEGGEVTRLSYLDGSPYPGAAVMGRIDDEAYSEEIGRRVAREIFSAGFNLALGPVADVNSNPLNPVIGTRSFGPTAELASRHVAAWVRGLEGEGAIACPKHFPGHGDTGQDSHHELPAVAASRELLTSRDLPPFGAAFDAGARSVMTSHIVLTALDPDVPATFSPLILRDLLRDQLGFAGVIVSDALDMQGASGEIGIPEAAVRALAAGCDLLCVGVDTTHEQLIEIVSHVARAVADGRIPAERIADAAERVRALSAASAQAAGSDSSPRDAVTPAEIARIADSFAGTADARAWLAANPGAHVLRVDSEANMAVGFAPWGPFAAAHLPFPGQEAQAAAFSARAEFDPSAAYPTSGVIVIGRELHRAPAVLARIDALLAAGTPVLAVEMGWPVEAQPSEFTTTRYACLSTYGSSALVGAALLDLLESSAS